jgi:hypothetical protein
MKRDIFIKEIFLLVENGDKRGVLLSQGTSVLTAKQ